MPSKFAEKVIKAAKAETALRLSAAETHQLATELGQMSLLIMKLLHSDLEAKIEPDALAGMACDFLFVGLPNLGLQLSTDGTGWWGRVSEDDLFLKAGSFGELIELIRRETSLPPASAATLTLKGADLYAQLESLSV